MIPQLVPLAHRQSPLRHRAFRIILADVRELLLRLLVPERVEQRHAALERFLDCRCARYRKVHAAQLRLGQILVMVPLIVGEQRKDTTQHDCERKGETFHERPRVQESLDREMRQVNLAGNGRQSGNGIAFPDSSRAAAKFISPARSAG